MESKIKILYIDDEELNLTAFVRLFRRLYDITTASSAKAGGEILKNQSFHVILVDQRMPGTTGSEFFKEIANIYPNSLRVLVTAYSDLDAVISAVNEGKIYKYISKPYKKEVMMEVITNAYQVYHFRAARSSNFNKYKEAFSNSKESIFLISEESKVIDVNDACLNLLELSRDELITQEAEINIFEKISATFKLSPSSTEYKEFDNVEATFQMKNGEIHDCLVSFTKINTAEGNLIGYQGTIKNISKYKESKRSSMRGLLEQKVRENETVVNVLHEKSAQNLSGIHFLLKQLEKKSDSQDTKDILAEVNSTLVETINELRDVCFQILPKSLDFGISGALEDLAKKIEAAYKSNCNVMVKDELPNTSRDFKIMLFRTIQNILRGLEKEHSDLSIEISSDHHNIFSEVTGKKSDQNENIIDQVTTEIDCYSGSITQQPAMNNQTCYVMVFPLSQTP